MLGGDDGVQLPDGSLHRIVDDKIIVGMGSLELHLDVYKRQALGPEGQLPLRLPYRCRQGEAVPAEIAVLRQESIRYLLVFLRQNGAGGIHPVSYTHLDVYKRQD